MQSLAAVAFTLLIGVSTLVGVRLLILHRRTGGWPELLLGGMLLLSVAVGYPLRIASDRAHTQWSGALLVGSEFAIAIGFSLLFVFTWRVFRPQAGWARALTFSAVAIQLGKAVHGYLQVREHGAIDMLDLPLGDILLQTGPVFVAYFWTAWESLRYHGAMRRRVRLGLADAVVSDRFRLWGLMGLCATGGVTLNTVAVALHFDVMGAAMLFASSVLGLLEALFLVLTFVPPSSYLSWVRARAALAAA